MKLKLTILSALALQASANLQVHVGVSLGGTYTMAKPVKKVAAAAPAANAQAPAANAQAPAANAQAPAANAKPAPAAAVAAQPEAEKKEGALGLALPVIDLQIGYKFTPEWSAGLNVIAMFDLAKVEFGSTATDAEKTAAKAARDDAKTAHERDTTVVALKTAFEKAEAAFNALDNKTKTSSGFPILIGAYAMGTFGAFSVVPSFNFALRSVTTGLYDKENKLVGSESESKMQIGLAPAVKFGYRFNELIIFTLMMGYIIWFGFGEEKAAEAPKAGAAAAAAAAVPSTPADTKGPVAELTGTGFVAAGVTFSVMG